MGTTCTYTFSLRDMISPAARRITAATAETAGMLQRLGGRAEALRNQAKEAGGSLGALRARLDVLKTKKELVPVSDLRRIRQYNREIDGLTGRIDKLDRAGRGGGVGKALRGLAGSPWIRAAGAVVGSGMAFDENMAKANVEARLRGADYQALKDRTRAIAAANRADEADAAAALAQIIGQTGDADLSLSILDSTLKGAKSQFAGVDVVAGALAQTLSIVGKENTNAQEVLDTFAAAKRVGAGEFGDFAQYMPSLIAGAGTLGIRYKEVAGMFAYLTGKGRRPDQANGMMEGLFAELGRGEVRDKLSKSGIEVYDRAGRIRSLPDIFEDMRKVTAPMTGEQKSGFFEGLGVTDTEAKNAFMAMSADAEGLAHAFTAVADSAGETDRAMEYARNTAMTAAEVWNRFRAVGTQIGTAVLPIVAAGLEVAGGLLTVVTPLVGGVAAACGWWFGALRDGNPLVWGVSASLGALGVVLAAHKVQVLAVAAAHRIAAAGSALLGGAFRVLNGAFMTSPVGWIILGVGALAGVVAALTGRTDKATGSFAAFNTELARTREETAAGFDAAIQAKEGSEERAAAIKKINEQYGEYLPYLLTEKSTNEELRSALDLVNVELERKIRNKFRDQAMDEAQSAAEEARTAALNSLLDMVDEGQRQALAADFNAAWNRLKAGTSDWKSEEAQLQKKYGIGTGFLSYLKGGISFDGLYSNVGEQMMNLQNAAYRLGQATERIDLLYGTGAPSATTVSPFVNGVYNPGAAALLNGGGNLPGAAALTGSNASATGNGTTPKTYAELMAGRGGSGGTGTIGGSVSDLDKIPVQDKKGSIGYGAIVAKLRPVRMPGLAAAAASVALPMSVASAQLPTVAPATNPPHEWFSGNRPQQVSIGTIEIHIARMDDKGRETITDEVETAILNALNVV